ncbi:MAG: hypothetical protein C4576_30080 [Desulfobacteraceae bacterium]|nr:MAG: hypothetical protein C4576_30080 [Desulfobacteraceae bacterium]
MQIGHHGVRAVQVSNPSRSPVIEVMTAQKAEYPGDGRQADALPTKQKMSPDLVIAGLPFSSALVREIPVALDSPKKVGRIIKYQMEPLVPYPVEELIVDYLPAESGRALTVIGMRKDSISACIEDLRKARIDPGIISLDGLALYGLFLRLQPEEPLKAAALVHKETAETLVMIIQGGRLAMIRALQADQPAEIRRTLDLYKLKNQEGRIDRILLTGSEADESFARDLSRETEMEVTPWRPFDQCRHNLGEIDTRTQMLYAVPLGLAVGSFAAPLRRFNLRREELAVLNSANLKRPLVYMTASFLMLAALVTFTTFHRLHQSERDYTALRSEIHSLFKSACPDVPSIIKGMELEQMKQKVHEGMREYQWLEELTGKGPALEVLLVLTRNLAGFKNVKVDNISIEGKRVDLDGRASSFQSVDSMKDALERTGFFTQVRLVGAKMDNKDKMVRFNLVMERTA